MRITEDSYFPLLEKIAAYRNMADRNMMAFSLYNITDYIFSRNEETGISSFFVLGWFHNYLKLHGLSEDESTDSVLHEMVRFCCSVIPLRYQQIYTLMWRKHNYCFGSNIYLTSINSLLAMFSKYQTGSAAFDEKKSLFYYLFSGVKAVEHYPVIRDIFLFLYLSHKVKQNISFDDIPVILTTIQDKMSRQTQHCRKLFDENQFVLFFLYQQEMIFDELRKYRLITRAPEGECFYTVLNDLIKDFFGETEGYFDGMILQCQSGP